MDTKQLESELERLKEELGDIEEEKHFMLEKTYIHVPGSAKKRYEDQIQALKERIREIEDQLENARE
jgi:hypothetical protein